MPIYKKLFYLIVLLPVIGCSPFKPYSAPNMTDFASLTIDVSELSKDEKFGYNFWIQHFIGKMDGYNCSMVEPDIIAILKNGSVISKYADQGKNIDAITINIPANEEFRFMVPVIWVENIKLSVDFSGMIKQGMYGFAISANKYECYAHSGFVPKPGKNYVAVANFEYPKCEFKVFEYSSDKYTRLDVAYDRYPPCVGNLGGFVQTTSSEIIKNFNAINQ